VARRELVLQRPQRGDRALGYSTKPFPEAEYVASAKLVSYLTAKYGIAKDRAHVIGHDQIPNGNRIASSSPPCSASPKQCQTSTDYGGAARHTDPGIWEWAVFMDRLGGTAKCNDVTALWNCSDDGKHAFRCDAGKVEVNLCDGPGACEVKPTGDDDVCNMQPKTVPAPADPGWTPSGDDGAEPGDAPAPGRQPTSAAVDATAADDGGCAIGPRRPTSAAAPVGFLVAALVLTRRRNRRVSVDA
jgi:hypothetical protein